MVAKTQERVYDLLHRMPQDGLTAAKQLFWTELNYDRANEPLSRRNWPERAGDALDGDPLFAAITALRDHVRQVSGLHQQRRDRPLMEQAFKQDGTHLRLNPLADPDPSSSQQNEQRGFRVLYCGVITALRNPLVHEGPSSSFAQTRYPDRKTMLKYRSFLSILFERDERDQEVPTLLLGMRRRLRSRHMRRQYR